MKKNVVNIDFSHLDDESLPIAAVEHNGRIAFANSALEALLGVPHKQIEGEWQLVHTKASEHPVTDQNEVNKELLRNLAHEIKNPLGGIRGAAQLLQMDMTDKSLIEYTQVIIHEADRLQSLVDRLLAPHRQPHVLGTVNVHEICERVRQLILVEFPHGLTVVRDYDASIPEFQGDREQLIQALLNIAHNAAQALEEQIAEGSATLTFRTRIARQVLLGKARHKLALQLHVIDNGPGVPDEIKDRIFYPLVTGRAGGSGLGLSLAQNFVQQHAGVIECDSSPGRTDFKIVVPL
jgi:two-component system, NtrC family, nitrogen regulation sensor histidine kinase GlnL